jgi:predicted regulator of Ras-like GTPase activity (Roadblock/LC7/MglB family)
MSKKKTNMRQETATAIIVDEDEIATNSSENQTFTDLTDKLAELRKQKGFMGYIIRNATSATIDLKDPERIVEYALFSSQLLDASQEISDLFKLADVENVVIEGAESKAICININGNKISIFIEKGTDHTDILKQLSP